MTGCGEHATKFSCSLKTGVYSLTEELSSSQKTYVQWNLLTWQDVTCLVSGFILRCLILL